MGIKTNSRDPVGVKNRQTHNALLRLSSNREDAAALIVVFEENREAILAAVSHWLGSQRKYEQAGKSVLLAIGQQARYFNPEIDDACEWVRERAYVECRRLRLEIEASSAAYN
jgi:hypothetical protein